MLSSHKGVCTQWPGMEETLTSRDYRYIAYRAFSYWTHGDDCRGNTLEPPLCVLHKIIQVTNITDAGELHYFSENKHTSIAYSHGGIHHVGGRAHTSC